MQSALVPASDRDGHLIRLHDVQQYELRIEPIGKKCRATHGVLRLGGEIGCAKHSHLHCGNLARLKHLRIGLFVGYLIGDLVKPLTTRRPLQ